jgi:hypothetical protein
MRHSSLRHSCMAPKRSTLAVPPRHCRVQSSSARLIVARSLMLPRHSLSRYSTIFGLQTADLHPGPRIDSACTLKKEHLREPPCARGRCISIPKHAYDSVALPHGSVAFASPFELRITGDALPKDNQNRAHARFERNDSQRWPLSSRDATPP